MNVEVNRVSQIHKRNIHTETLWTTSGSQTRPEERDPKTEDRHHGAVRNQMERKQPR